MPLLDKPTNTVGVSAKMEVRGKLGILSLIWIGFRKDRKVARFVRFKRYIPIIPSQ